MKKKTKFNIPDSKIPRPKDFGGTIKYFFWHAIYPIFAEVRDGLITLHIIHHEGRQRFLLGKLAPGKEVEGFLKHLEKKGFGNHFVAWEDEGEVIGLRRLDGFTHQYHLRVFNDGEVRVHYEFTPEHHPYLHWAERGEEERGKDFLSFCGNWVIPV